MSKNSTAATQEKREKILFYKSSFLYELLNKRERTTIVCPNLLKFVSFVKHYILALTGIIKIKYFEQK